MTGKNHVLVNLYPVEVAEGYESLFGVLQEALNQAQFGKGHERYAEPEKPSMLRTLAGRPGNWA